MFELDDIIATENESCCCCLCCCCCLMKNSDIALSIDVDSDVVEIVAAIIMVIVAELD